MIREADEEFKRRGRFKRIFPSPLYTYYKQFFEEERPMNVLLSSRIRKKQDRSFIQREMAQLGLDEKMKGVGVGALILRSKSRQG